MRERKQGDSPSDFDREVGRRVNRFREVRPTDAEVRIDGIAFSVLSRVRRLLSEQPHLAGEDPRVLFSRMAVPATVVDYESALTRAALAVLLVAALDRAEMASPFTGGEAA